MKMCILMKFHVFITIYNLFIKSNLKEIKISSAICHISILSISGCLKKHYSAKKAVP